MKKPILFVIIAFILSLSACSPEASPSASVSPSPSASPSQSPDAGQDQDVQALIVGGWDINRAENTQSGEAIPLNDLYGTGIRYGGELMFDAEGTFSRYIGVTDGEKASHWGTYSVTGNGIALTYDNGQTVSAEYDPETGEMRYYLEDDPAAAVTEYYVRGKLSR